MTWREQEYFFSIPGSLRDNPQKLRKLRAVGISYPGLPCEIFKFNLILSVTICPFYPLWNVRMSVSIRIKANQSKPGGTLSFDRKKKMSWYLAFLPHSWFVCGRDETRRSCSPRVEAVGSGVENQEPIMDFTTVKMSENEGQSIRPVRAEGGWAGKGGPDTELRQPHISTANVSSTNSCQVDRGHGDTETSRWQRTLPPKTQTRYLHY